ncbi:VanW family protein [Paenisporosarcina cavernae]|uniref:G5 domain-containing protein n=1 Tax=Paenisporosarcina cavernae TaxID=2320858 RepID=A0A385YTX5_9BACL|nr:VanW family protein [Paenisporosarcina cavernae]AYC29760.1 hypothetical protein D3873_07585 [Paenisporosarcina cavernae]
MERQNSIQFFLITLLIGVILLAGTFGFSTVSSAIFGTVNSPFEDGTTIGETDVSGLTPQQAKKVLEKDIVNWQENYPISMQVLFKQVLLNPEVIQFDMENSIAEAKNGTQNDLLVLVDEVKLQQSLEEIGYRHAQEQHDFQALKQLLTEKAAHYEKSSVPVNLIRYMSEVSADEGTISDASLPINVQDESPTNWIRNHSTISVPIGEKISLNTLLNDDPTGLYSAEFKTKLASTLYAASLNAPIEVVSRSISESNQYNVPLGTEAYLSETTDLVIKNSYGYPITIQSSISGSTLSVEIRSRMTDLHVTAQKSDQNVLPFRVQIQLVTNPYLVKTELGKEGREVTVSRTIFIGSDEIDTFVQSVDTYFPINEIQYRLQEVASPEQNGSPASPGSTYDSSGGQTNTPTTPSTGTPSTDDDSNPTGTPPGGTDDSDDPDSIEKDDQHHVGK